MDVQRCFAIHQGTILIVGHCTHGLVNNGIVACRPHRRQVFLPVADGTCCVGWSFTCLVIQELGVVGQTFIHKSIALDIVADNIVEPLMSHFVDNEGLEVRIVRVLILFDDVEFLVGILTDVRIENRDCSNSSREGGSGHRCTRGRSVDVDGGTGDGLRFFAEFRQRKREVTL